MNWKVVVLTSKHNGLTWSLKFKINSAIVVLGTRSSFTVEWYSSIFWELGRLFFHFCHFRSAVRFLANPPFSCSMSQFPVAVSSTHVLFWQSLDIVQSLNTTSHRACRSIKFIWLFYLEATAYCDFCDAFQNKSQEEVALLGMFDNCTLSDQSQSR